MQGSGVVCLRALRDAQVPVGHLPKITGKSALHWIEYYAVHEILLLLNDPAMTLTEVTDRMHFPAPPMLTRYLKRAIGKTPSEYRMGQV